MILNSSSGNTQPMYAIIEGSLQSFIADITGDDLPDKIPLMGVIVFTPSVSHVVDRTTGSLTYMGPEQVTTDEDGHFKIALIATDSPYLNPVGWHYLVEISIPNKPKLRVRAQFVSGGTYTLGDVVTVANPGIPVNVVSVPNSAVLTALQSQINELAKDVAKIASSGTTVDVSDIQSQIDSLKTTVDNLPETYDDTALKMTIANMQEQINSLPSGTNSTYDDSALQGKVSTLDQSVTEVKSNLSVLARDLQSRGTTLDYLATSDGYVFSGIDLSEIDLSKAGIQSLTYTTSTIVSIKTGARLVGTLCIHGWENVTWAGVVVHGEPSDLTKDVWCSLVCKDKDTDDWHLFVDSGATTSTLPEFIPGNKDNSSALPPGMYITYDQAQVDTLNSPTPMWNQFGVSGRTSPTAPAVVIVEDAPINPFNSLNSDGTVKRYRNGSLAASRTWVANNFVPLSYPVQLDGSPGFPEVDPQYLPTIGSQLARHILLTEGVPVGFSLIQDGDADLVLSNQDLGGEPVSKTDGTSSPLVDSLPYTAYHTKLDKMVMWSPKTKMWRNLDGTAL